MMQLFVYETDLIRNEQTATMSIKTNRTRSYFEVTVLVTKTCAELVRAAITPVAGLAIGSR
jgi:hypothetical protein